MAFGFTPKHTEELLIQPNQTQFLAAGLMAVETLGWKLVYHSESGLIAYTDNGFFSSNFEVKLVIKNGTATLTSSSLGSEMFDFGKNKKTVLAFILALDEAKQQYSEQTLEQKHQEFIAQIPPEEEDLLQLPPATAKENLVDFFRFFMPRTGFFITPILVWLNLLVFIAMTIAGANVFQPSIEILLKWGANYRPMTLNGEWWRLLTNCFVHIGVLHLLFNMFALVYVAIFLEPLLGRTRFAVAYLLTGITASVTSLYWHDLVVSAGASGAIFGLYGVFLALLCTDVVEKKARKSLLISMGIFVVYNLIYGLKGGIDNAAHIGGLIPGFLIGFGLLPSLKKTESPAIKYISIAFLSLLVVAGSGAVYYNLPNNSATNSEQMLGIAKTESKGSISTNPNFDQRAYDEKMIEFHSVQSLATDIFPIDTTMAGKEKSLSDIKDVGIYYWKRGIDMLNGMDETEMPANLAKRNQAFRKYCEKNLQMYETMYKAIDEHTHKYDEQIRGYMAESRDMITSIRNSQ